MYKLVTFNIRLDRGWDNTNNWEYRIPLVKDFFDRHNADIYCFQEVLPHVKPQIQEMLGSDYVCVGMGRDSDFTNEASYICVNKKVLEIVEFTNFCLSPTPHIIGSKFDEKCSHSRICTQVLLYDKNTQSVFRVFNAHLESDYIDYAKKGLEIILDKVTQLNNIKYYPFILCGDYNATEKDILPIIDNYRDKCQLNDFSELETNQNITYHEWGNKEKFKKIDYIFASKEVKKIETVTDIYSNNGVYLSDHYPIITKFKI